MKKLLLIAFTGLSIMAGAALADDNDRDWREIHKAQEHVKKAFDILRRAKKEKRFENDDNVETAINLLRNAKSELGDTLDNIKKR